MLQVNFVVPPGGVNSSSIAAWLISDATGQVIPIPENFWTFIATNADTGEQYGVFGYNGLLQGFPLPTDAGFWGTNPAKATFSVRFENLGVPFTLLDSPQKSVFANLDSNNTRFPVVTNSVIFPAKVTVATGEEFTAHASACSPFPQFPCPPQTLTISLFTEPPADGARGYRAGHSDW
jgi:hypothetical protein